LNLKNILFLVFVLILFWVAPLDPDLGWHLRYGQKIFEEGQVYRDNSIGYFLTDHLWTLNYSLYQWLIFVLEKYVGVWSLSVVQSALMVAMFGVIKKIFKLDLISEVMVVLYFWLLSLPVVGLGLRPQVLSTVFLVLTYAILIKRRWWWLIPLSLVWANAHGAFILELIVMSTYFGQLLIKKDRQIVKFGLIGLLVVGVSLINPFGVGIYEEALRHSWYPLNQLIAEWLPPANSGIALILITISVVAMTIVSLTYKNKKAVLKKNNFLFLIVSWLFFLGLAFKARRNLSLFGVASIFMVMNLVKVKIKEGWLVWVAVCLLIVFIVARTDILSKKVDWALIEKERSYPMGAIEYLKTDNKCQNIYNTYEWGGYLVWKLPQKKFFVDGRMPAWDNLEKKSPYTIYLEIIQARPGWSDRVTGYGTDCLLISKGTFLDLEIRDESKNWQDVWKIVYEDERSVVYDLAK